MVSIEEVAVAGEVIERIHVSTGMAAHGNAVRRGAHTGRVRVVAVQFGQRKQKWRMRGMVGHTHKIRLCQIENAALQT